MNEIHRDTQHPTISGAQFDKTQWSQVIRATDATAEGSSSALQNLCQSYWYPLYAFVRRSGHSPQDAEDLTQTFFARLLDKNYLASADQEKGRFRTFLIVALKRFLANEFEKQHAIKRGGFSTFVEIDQEHAEALYGEELAIRDQPDSLLEKQWAITLIENVMKRLQTEYIESDRSELFNLLRSSITRDHSAMGYAKIAEHLKTTEAAVKMAAMRMRERYQTLLREEIGRTVASPDDIDDEIRHLFAVFSS
jgi:RNA polymerase sigma-70 factor (ECF subfamily)